MERERWLRLYQQAVEISRRWRFGVRFNVSAIVGVYLWAVLHERPISWACQQVNWSRGCGFSRLPSQSTMSRRLQSAPVQQLLNLMEVAIKEATSPVEETATKLIDAKPLPIGGYSKDPDARWGRATSGFAKGYKFYAIWGKAAVPDTWEIRSMNEHEQRLAEQMIPRLHTRGRLLGDSIYDSNSLHDLAFQHNLQLLAPRRRKRKTKRKYKESPHRQIALAYLEGGGWSTFHRERTDIERRFGNWTSFGGGMAPLPSWVRRLTRVRLWVQAKLLINADRIVQRQRLASA
jgi:hypothetical protein